MNYEIQDVRESDRDVLVALRLSAMKESLERVGRYDPVRARNRFLVGFKATDTKKIIINENIVGFFVLRNNEDHLLLDHLYVDPGYQGTGLGGMVMSSIKQYAKELKISIRLGALKLSKANEFYKKHGFVQTHEEEWDIYYEFKHV